VFASWTKQSLPSGSTVVENPTRLAFVDEPSDTVANSTIVPEVTVAVMTADGGAFTTAGTSITLAIGNNPSTGALGGTITAATGANGMAAFTTVSINQPGVGYTLTASSPGLTPGTSAAFTVLAPPLLGAAQNFSLLG
ncbi:hypothetical protein GWE18_41540, partial [Bradyrhizobium sp. CSA112]|uniref:hypothetical protein n=1 Tax=Bradyrhizobium sp. CSA112 TaxID=2699170 RepID=UPI0023AF9B64